MDLPTHASFIHPLTGNETKMNEPWRVRMKIIASDAERKLESLNRQMKAFGK